MALAQDTRRPLYEIQGLVSFYPHFRTDPPPAVEPAPVPRPVLLAARRRGQQRRPARPVRRRPRRRGARGLLPRPLRHRAGRRGRRPAGDRARGRRPGAEPRAAGKPQELDPSAAAPLAQRPVRRRGEPQLPGAARPAGRPPRRRPRSSQTLHDSGLRGMGGAGFPTGKKWALVADQPAARRTSCATPTSPSPAPSRTGRSWPTSRTSCWRACCSGWSWSAPRRAGSSSGTSTARRPTCSAPSSTGCAPRACSATTSWAPAGGCRSRCSCRPAATSSARRRRCSSAWRATAASRATSRRSPASTASGAGRP